MCIFGNLVSRLNVRPVSQFHSKTWFYLLGRICLLRFRYLYYTEVNAYRIFIKKCSKYIALNVTT